MASPARTARAGDAIRLETLFQEYHRRFEAEKENPRTAVENRPHRRVLTGFPSDPEKMHRRAAR
jgi:hypothetical protein